MSDTATLLHLHITPELIKEKLAIDDRWLKRGIVSIWENQTCDERDVKSTNHSNGIGFTGADAPFLSSLAEQINKGYKLSPKQIAAARKAMVKYTGQLYKKALNKQ